MFMWDYINQILILLVPSQLRRMVADCNEVQNIPDVALRQIFQPALSQAVKQEHERKIG